MRKGRCRWCNQPWIHATRQEHAMQCPAMSTLKSLMAQGKPHPSGHDPILVMGAILFNGKIEKIDD